MDQIYKLQLHQEIRVDFINKNVIRVPGGWIYSDQYVNKDMRVNPVFVPYSYEFTSHKELLMEFLVWIDETIEKHPVQLETDNEDIVQMFLEKTQ